MCSAMISTTTCTLLVLQVLTHYLKINQLSATADCMTLETSLGLAPWLTILYVSEWWDATSRIICFFSTLPVFSNPRFPVSFSDTMSSNDVDNSNAVSLKKWTVLIGSATCINHSLIRVHVCKCTLFYKCIFPYHSDQEYNLAHTFRCKQGAVTATYLLKHRSIVIVWRLFCPFTPLFAWTIPSAVNICP